MKQSRLPKGWDEERFKRVLDHYENQTEDSFFEVIFCWVNRPLHGQKYPLNLKSETLNSKQIQNSKYKCTKPF